MLRRYFSILLLFLALPMASVGRNALSAAEPNPEKSLTPTPSFKNEIGPLLQAKCSRCHNEKAHKRDLNLTEETLQRQIKVPPGTTSLLLPRHRQVRESG